MKKIILILTLLFAGTTFAQQITPLRPVQGGTGISSTTPASVGLCLKVLDDSPFTYEFATCGSGGGGGGGTFGTSTVANYSTGLINYPLNATDVVLFGSTSATSTAEYWFDPNFERALIGRTTSASTTISGSVYLPQISQGIVFIGSNNKMGSTATTTATCAGTLSCTAFTVLGATPVTLTGGGTFPFTAFTSYNATGTAIGFHGGLFSTASSTFNGAFRLPALSNGGLAVINGLVSSGATTTAGTGLTYSGNAFNVNTTQNISKLSNLTGNGLVVTSGGDGTLGTAVNGTDFTLITALTCSGTDKISAVTADGTFTCSADSAGSGGSGGGAFSTTTSTVSGQLIVYPNNSATDIVVIGGTATTSAEFFFDPNVSQFAFNSWNMGTTTTTVCKNRFECKYTTISSALSAGWRDIFVKDGTYAEQITVSNTKVKLRAQSLNTIIQCNGTTQTPCLAGNDELTVDGFTFNETNGRIDGVAFDGSDHALQKFINNRVNNFSTSTMFRDTASLTFYNTVAGNTFFNTRTCFDFSGTQSNANWMSNNRCRPILGGGGYGLFADDARGLFMSGGDIEGPAGESSGTSTAVYFSPTSRDNKISGVWIEALGTGLNVASGSNNNTIDGTTISSNGVDIVDNGTNTRLLGVNRTGTKLFNIGHATSTSFAVTALTSANCDVLSDASGNLYCGTNGSGGGSGDPFTHPTNTSSATTSLMLLYGNASTTGFSANYAKIGQTASTTFGADGFVGISTTTRTMWGLDNPILNVQGTTTINGYLALGLPRQSDVAWTTNQLADVTCKNAGYCGVTFSNLDTGTTASVDLLFNNNATSQSIFSYLADIGFNGSGNADPLYTGLGGAHAFYQYNTDGQFAQAIATTSSVGFFNWLTGGYLTSNEKMRLTNGGLFGLATTTPSAVAQMTIASSTKSQLSLSAGAGEAQWTFRNAGGNLYLSTTTVSGLATTSTSALTLNKTGFGIAGGTTTPSATYAFNTLGGLDVMAIGSSTGEYFRINSTGQVYLPKLVSSTAGNAICYIGASNQLVIAGNTTCATSSYYDKDTTGGVSKEVAEYIVKRMSAVTFSYKDQNNEHYGFIAEEVAQIDRDVKEKFGVDARLAEYAKDDFTRNGHLFKKGDPTGVEYANYTAILTVYLQNQEESKNPYPIFIIVLVLGYIAYNEYYKLKQKNG